MDPRVRAVIAFMNDNLHRRLSVKEITQTVNLSPSRLRELFKEETETSLARYRRELRMERAKHLLETTFLSVKEVAASVGLTSVGQFAIDFKEAYRMTPSEYAERHRKH
jgi:transcriptional regulator GlxA family with amidase domain